MTSDRLFFELAVALIPILVFGASVTSLNPEETLRNETRHKRLSWVLGATFIVVFAIVAETVAIYLALTDSFPIWWQLVIVLYGVLGGAALLGIATLRPWFRQLRDTGAEGWIKLAGNLSVRFGVPLAVGIASLLLTHPILNPILEEKLEARMCAENRLEILVDETDEAILDSSTALTELAQVALSEQLSKRESRLYLKAAKIRTRVAQHRAIEAHRESRSALRLLREQQYSLLGC